MIKTVRLSYFGNDWDGIKVKIENKLLNEFHLPMGGYSGDKFNGWHIGNYCFVYVLENFANKLVEIFPELNIDAEYNFLEKSDLSIFKVNDKVMIGGMFGNQKGKIYSITEDCITVLKAHSQSKGWKFFVGDPFNVVRI